jgi:ATP-dependent DNA helicase DinG
MALGSHPKVVAVRGFDPDVDDPIVDSDVDVPERRVDSPAQAAALDLLARITSDLPGGGETRDGQRAMTSAVVDAIATGHHVFVEAGTGVGKSLAYLVPAVLAGRRTVVATATKNLQDQLALKDAPFVAAHVPELRVAVLKGRANYLCRQRLKEVGGEGQLALEVDDLPTTVTAQVRRIIDWSRTTESGERDELAFEPDHRAWRSVSVTPHECPGKTRCAFGSTCFAERAKDLAAAADVVVVNTHLYGAHLSAGATILPNHDVVIFDEAHEVPEIFAQLLGTSVSPSHFRTVAQLARPALSNSADLLARTGDFADRLARALSAQVALGIVTGLGESVTTLLDEGRRLVTEITTGLRDGVAGTSGSEEKRLRALGPAVHLSNDLTRLSSIASGELLWLSPDREVSIELSLIDVGPRLTNELWPNVTGVFTSATIPDNLPSRVGLGELATVERVPSPFDYQTHGLLYVPHNMPARTDDAAEVVIVDELVALIAAAGGRTLALFTNRSVMHRVADAVTPRISTPVLVQDSLSRARLLSAFRDDESSSLFAVTSYWQGVDVPGASLSMVTIDRLPFARPDDPLNQARRERAGDRAFTDVDLPRAAMLLAQGVGRLIRTTEDRGVVAVLDTRLATATYRHRLLARLPPMRRTRSREDVVAFLRTISGSDLEANDRTRLSHEIE